MSPRLSPGVVVVVVVVSFSRSFAVAALVVDVEGRCQIQAKASIRPFASNLPTPTTLAQRRPPTGHFRRRPKNFARATATHWQATGIPFVPLIYATSALSYAFCRFRSLLSLIAVGASVSNRIDLKSSKKLVGLAFAIKKRSATSLTFIFIIKRSGDPRVASSLLCSHYYSADS